MRFTLALLLISVLASCEKECPTCEKPEECPTCQTPAPCPISEGGNCNGSCAADLARGLVAHYPFNGNLNDVSGNNFTLQAMNGATLGTDFLGRQFSAATFDGSNDYFIAPNDAKFNTDSVSLSCIVMVKSNFRRHTLINKLNPTNVTSFVYGLGQSQAQDNKWSFAVPDNMEDCATAATFQPSNAIYSNSVIEPGRWYNVIATFGKDGQKLYVDGKLAASTIRTFSTLKKCATGNLLIGGWWDQDIISLDGKMDEVRVYNRILSQCEIDKLASTFN